LLIFLTHTFGVNSFFFKRKFYVLYSKEDAYQQKK
jgi:hypothetical protein